MYTLEEDMTDYDDECALEYAAQGGGIVKWSDTVGWYVFTEDPPHGYRVRQEMPRSWGVAPIDEVVE